MDEYIAKKDLLQEMQITYGQLYRWKRKRLIPENWFIKRSSFTGQETFFPREEIKKRIKIIKDLKDHYSLDDLAKMLNGENVAPVVFSFENMTKSSCFLPSSIQEMAYEEYDYDRVLKLIILDEINRLYNEEVQLASLSKLLRQCDLTQKEYKVMTLGIEGNFFILQHEQLGVYYDEDLDVGEIYDTYRAKEKYDKIKQELSQPIVL